MSSGGFVKARMDYTAYGEDIGAGTGLRTNAQGFDAAINPRQQYGLTERDDATGLDHTWFRKNENRGGRWTSPDPYNGSISLGDPQSLNRFSYVQGQPTNYIDPSGLLIRVYKCDETPVIFLRGGGESRNCRWVYIDIGNGPTTTGGNEGEETGGGGGGETSVVPAGGDDYDYKRCADLAKKIANIEEDMAKRIMEWFINPERLPQLPPFPGAGDWTNRLGHERIIERMANNLKAKRKEYEDHCRGGGRRKGGGRPAQAPKPVPAPIPIRPPSRPRIRVPVVPLRPATPIIGPPPIVFCALIRALCIPPIES